MRRADVKQGAASVVIGVNPALCGVLHSIEKADSLWYEDQLGDQGLPLGYARV